MVAPDQLTDISTASTAWGYVEYRIFDETVAGRTYYKGWHTGLSPPDWWHDTSIYVDHATNTWYDGDTGTASTHVPYIKSQDATYVVLGGSGGGIPDNELFKFAKPLQTVWPSSGSGGGSTQKKVFRNFW